MVKEDFIYNYGGANKENILIKTRKQRCKTLFPKWIMNE